MKKTTFVTTNKLASGFGSVEEPLSMIKENESASSSTVSKNNLESPPLEPNTVGTTTVVARRRSSLSSSSTTPCVHEQESLSAASSTTSLKQQQAAEQPSYHTCGNVRRTSMPARRSTPAFVHQDELWLTQRQCKPKCLLNDGTPPSDGTSASALQTIIISLA